MWAYFLEQTKMYKFIDIQHKWDIAFYKCPFFFSLMFSMHTRLKLYRSYVVQMTAAANYLQ